MQFHSEVERFQEPRKLILSTDLGFSTGWMRIKTKYLFFNLDFFSDHNFLTDWMIDSKSFLDRREIVFPYDGSIRVAPVLERVIAVGNVHIGHVDSALLAVHMTGSEQTLMNMGVLFRHPTLISKTISKLHWNFQERFGQHHSSFVAEIEISNRMWTYSKSDRITEDDLLFWSRQKGNIRKN